MAVVQISRIQVRRGKSLSGTGLPQLASGELAWSLDTQELFIGNGSVAEGSPAVGNTKILTERDLTVQGNLLNLLNHIYKSNDPAIQTGPTSNTPVSRTVQDRLDDYVTVADFGAVADGSTDDSAALQRAIDQLFLNPTTSAYSDTADATSARVILRLAPGIYNITSTLYIPSYASIMGSGANKTIISYTGTGPAIRFINDSSTIGNPSSIGNTLGNTQPRYINMRGMTIRTNTDNQVGMKLDAVRDSSFEDLNIVGDWGGTYDSESKGLELNAVSALVTSSNNIFKNLTITGFSHGVWAQQDILNNTFKDCLFTDLRQGIVLGDGADGTTVGEQYGPRETLIDNCKFEDIKRHAVYVGRGTGNTTRDSKLTNVGNDGAGVYFPAYPQIYFSVIGNTSQNDQSDRQAFLSGKYFTVDLTLDQPITASKGATVQQAVSNIRGTLKEDYVNDTFITVVTQYMTEFDTTNYLIIDDVYSAGLETTLNVVGSSSANNSFATSPLTPTTSLIQGAPVSFSNTVGGVVAGQTYYVKEVLDDTHFTISETYTDAFDTGVAEKGINTSTTSSVVTYTPTTTPTTVGDLTLVPYLPEIAGNVTYKSYATQQLVLGEMPSWSLVCSLPVSTTSVGTPTKSIGYEIDYQFKSAANSFTRKGRLTIIVDIDKSTSTHTTQAQLSDDFNVVGISEETALLLDFSVVLLNQHGAELSGLTDVPSALALRYKNAIVGETQSTLTYSYTAIH